MEAREEEVNGRRDRATITVSWLGLIISLITFSLFTIKNDADNQRNQRMRERDLEMRQQEAQAMKRIADVMEGIYGRRSPGQK